MFKFGSPFTAMFSPAPAAPDRIDADSGKSNVVSEATASVASPAPSVSGGIMDSVTSFGSLFTNAPDRWGEGNVAECLCQSWMVMFGYELRNHQKK